MTNPKRQRPHEAGADAAGWQCETVVADREAEHATWYAKYLAARAAGIEHALCLMFTLGRSPTAQECTVARRRLPLPFLWLDSLHPVEDRAVAALLRELGDLRQRAVMRFRLPCRLRAPSRPHGGPGLPLVRAA